MELGRRWGWALRCPGGLPGQVPRRPLLRPSSCLLLGSRAVGPWLPGHPSGLLGPGHFLAFACKAVVMRPLPLPVPLLLVSFRGGLRALGLPKQLWTPSSVPTAAPCCGRGMLEPRA